MKDDAIVEASLNSYYTFSIFSQNSGKVKKFQNLYLSKAPKKKLVILEIKHSIFWFIFE